MVSIARKGGGRGSCTVEGIDVGEPTAGMVYLHIHEGDRVAGSEGEAPNRGIQVHEIINADQPRFHEVTPLLLG